MSLGPRLRSRYLGSMQRQTVLFAWFLLSALLLNAEPRPVWSVDLGNLGVNATEASAVAFSGAFLLVYPNIYHDRPPLVFDIGSHQLLNGERRPTIVDSLPRPHFLEYGDLPDSSGRVVARRKQMWIEQVCDQPICVEPPGKPTVRDSKFYLRSPGQEPALIWEVHCLPGRPLVLADDRIMVPTCGLAWQVIDNSGRKLYRFSDLSDPYFAVSSQGNRLAVYERTGGFFRIEGYDHVRVRVFDCSNGKQLFHLRWPIGNDSIDHGRVALSDDGALVAILRSGQLLVFALR